MTSEHNKCHLKEKEVTPGEDFCQEHGLLNRILLIYEEFIQRIETGSDFDPNIVISSAQIIRSFIEDYHEKNEEKYVFPVVQKCPQFKQLVKTLIKQHKIGRGYTSMILELSHDLLAESNASTTKHLSDILHDLAMYLYKYVRMYRAHESREDTIIFKAFHELTPEKEYKNLGEIMDSIEQEKFGQDDYDHILSQIEEMEKSLGIYDLSTYS